MCRVSEGNQGMVNTTGSSKRKRASESEEASEATTGGLSQRESPGKRPNLTLLITNVEPPIAELDVASTSSIISGLSDPNSLFDEPITLIPSESSTSPTPSTLALVTTPPIHGLFFPNIRLPEETADSVMKFCLDTYFQTHGVNQAMLFGRSGPSESATGGGLPGILNQLLSMLDKMLLPHLPHETHNLLFPHSPSCARQAIVNLYEPGEGITPHVDLLKRFGDGIIGVSLGSGCVMEFCRVEKEAEPQASSGEIQKDRWDVYLPERSIIILSEDARYRWTHGIGKHTRDYVAFPEATGGGEAGRWIERGVRLSITFRWLLPGADIVGSDSDRS